jgi:hypothetical protein
VGAFVLSMRTARQVREMQEMVQRLAPPVQKASENGQGGHQPADRQEITAGLPAPGTLPPAAPPTGRSPG